MKINVAQVKKEIGSRHPFTFITPACNMDVSQLRFELVDDVKVTGEVVNNGRALEVSGVIYARMASRCDRCLEAFDAPLDIAFQEVFQETVDQVADETADVAYYQDDEIELAGLVEENLLMAEPLKALCKPGCLGLCPQCGVNRNVSPCHCSHDDIDPRLAKLRQLLKE
jgi:uncharacterized protein